MAMTALHHVRPLRGHTKPHLMMCQDGNAYIVKFQRNPAGCRVLACEYLSTKLAEAAGLPTPSCSVIDVCDFLIQNTKELASDCAATDGNQTQFHFGSRFVGNPSGDSVVDLLPSSYLHNASSANVFGGMLAFDKWTSNTDLRQAVFLRRKGDSHYSPYFIDNSLCFSGPKWNFTAGPRQGLFRNHDVYAQIRGWDSFEPFLERLLSASSASIWKIALEMPAEWYDDKRGELESLVEALLRRRSLVHKLINQLRNQTPAIFPAWSPRATVYFASRSSLQAALSAASFEL